MPLYLQLRDHSKKVHCIFLMRLLVLEDTKLVINGKNSRK